MTCEQRYVDDVEWQCEENASSQPGGPAEEESRKAVSRTERSERKGALTATDAVDMTQGQIVHEAFENQGCGIQRASRTVSGAGLSESGASRSACRFGQCFDKFPSILTAVSASHRRTPDVRVPVPECSVQLRGPTYQLVLSPGPEWMQCSGVDSFQVRRVPCSALCACTAAIAQRIGTVWQRQNTMISCNENDLAFHLSPKTRHIPFHSGDIREEFFSLLLRLPGVSLSLNDDHAPNMRLPHCSSITRVSAQQTPVP